MPIKNKLTPKTYTTRRFAVYEDTFQAYRECVRLMKERPGVRPHEVTHDGILLRALILLNQKLLKENQAMEPKEGENGG